ncbi:MAG: ABC transporter ATP-binding protein [Bacteroidia bacterium]|nr:ABC transporter ATP-binding protein [Bacteroidia bacterium]
MEQIKIKHLLNLKQAIRFVFDSSGKWGFTNIFLSLITGVMPLLIIYMTKQIIDSVSIAVNSADKTAALWSVITVIIITGIIFLINELCSNLWYLAREHQSQIASDYIFDVLHKKSTELDMEYYESPEHHDILHRARAEAPFRPARIVNNIIQILQNSISLILTAGLLFYFHWSIALVLLIATVPGLWIRMRYAGLLFVWSQKVTPTERKVRYFNWILTSEKFVKELRIFNLGRIFIDKFRDIRMKLRNERLRIILKRTGLELITQISASLAIFGCYAYIAYRTIHGLITIGDMVMFFLAFQKGFSFLRDILSSLAGLYEDNLFLSNLYVFLNLKPKIVNPENPVPFPSPIKKGIELHNVCFCYPNSTEVLKDITLEINAGETVALVGDNGAGKTTLIKLICRLYEPQKGEIMIDGININDFNVTDLRKNISVLFQDFSQYNISAGDNICFGDPPACGEATKEKLDEAAKNAGIDSLISTLPEKYNTTLGALFENSKEMSIGEWQKIALARAFYKNAPVLILDEPTSSMDAKTEYDFFINFKNLVKEKTALLVSHRFSTIKMADRIYVLDHENIIESGAHDELMKMKGKYAQLYNLQASKYV